MRRAIWGISVVCALLGGAIQARAAAPVTVLVNDDCRHPLPMHDGRPVDGETALALDDTHARNGEGFVAPEVVYSFTLFGLRQVTIQAVGTPFIPVTYVRTRCSDSSSEIAFDDLGKQIRVNLGPGTYYVFVDGDRGSYFDRGTFTLTYTTQVPPVGDRCLDPFELIPGEPANGDTRPLAQDYRASSIQTDGRDAVYSMVLDQPGHVHIDTAGSTFDTVLYVRSACDKPSSEIAANDDASEDTYSSAIDAELAAGRYYVFVDGYFARAAGLYSLTMAVAP